MNRLTLFLLSLAVAFSSRAQTPYDYARELPDSTAAISIIDSIAPTDISHSKLRATTTDRFYTPLTSDSLPSISFRQRYHIPQPGVAVISSWDNGAISVHGSTTHMPGLMGIERGRLNFGFSTGNITYNIYGEAVKYGYFNGLQTSYGIGADITYRFNDKLSLTLFGAYYSPVRANSHAAAGYFNSTNIGGYFDYSFSDKFGVQVGAQSYRSTLSRRWETQPIVKPYYRISSKASIGVDVGGIIYQLLKSNVGKNSWGPQNPTIGPPVMKLSEMMGY